MAAVAPNGGAHQAPPPPPQPPPPSSPRDIEASGGGGAKPTTGATSAAAAAASDPSAINNNNNPKNSRLPAACSPLRHLYEKRPKIVSQKTRKKQWRQLHSRWRWAHAFFFWAGPPAYLLARVWPVLLFNMILSAIVAADHLVRASAKPKDGRRNSLLPNITANVIESLSPMVLLLFAASMVFTLRLGRVYDRWWQVRQAFACVGSSTTAMAQRVSSWADPACPRQQRRASDFRRWAVVWHFSVMQVCQLAPEIHPDGAKLLTFAEMAIYKHARKGRQVAVDRLVQLIHDFKWDSTRAGSLEALLQKGVQSASVCTAVRFQALPYALTLISTGFVELFLITLVLLMVQSTGPGNHPENLPDTVFTVCVVWTLYFGICLLFLGADEVANQLEDPFPWLPLYDIVATTQRDTMRLPDELQALREVERAMEEEAEAEGKGLMMVDDKRRWRDQEG